MQPTIQTVVTAAQQLSPEEQLKLIQILSQSLQKLYHSPQTVEKTHLPLISPIPDTVRRTPPVTNLQHLAADFWPDDETADDFNDYIAQQRASERLADLDELADAA